jgi:5-methylthioadenosine/S-adenosylhomocysteine deaminase
MGQEFADNPAAPKTVDLLIEGGLVLTLDPDWQAFDDGAVAIDGQHVVAVGPREAICTAYRGRQVIDARRRLVMPGLINVHTHAAMTVFRGLADDLPVHEWLEKYIWPAEGRFMTPDTVYWGTLLAVAEMLRAGVTTFCDMYFHTEQIARAARQAGMRAVPSWGFTNFPLPGQSGPEDALAQAEDYVRRWQGDPLIVPSIGPHTPYTVDGKWIQAARALADRYGVLMHIHVSETRSEVEDSKAQVGLTPVHYLDRLGVLGPNVLAVHCVWVDASEIQVLAKRRAGIAHCPESNLKLGSGVAPLPRLLDAGVKVGLGTDGAASNNDLSILGEMQTAALLHKGIHCDPAAIKAATAVRMGTQGGAEALGIDHLVGSLEPGKRADLILLDLDQLHLVPLYNPYSHLAYAALGSDVETTIIDGQVVMRNRELLTIDETEVVARVREIASEISKA